MEKPRRMKGEERQINTSRFMDMVGDFILLAKLPSILTLFLICLCKPICKPG